MISDKRVISISRLSFVNGCPSATTAGYLKQSEDGRLSGCSSWFDCLIPNVVEHGLMADRLGISPLELARQQLCSIPYLKVFLI